MTSAYAAALVSLQEALQRPSDATQKAAGRLVIPFLVGSSGWFIDSEQVSRLLMPTALIQLRGYPSLPPFVAGAAAFDGEVFTVVDAGLLLASRPVAQSYRARLIALRSMQASGVALLVDRVLDRAREQELDDSWQRFDASRISSSIGKN